MKEKFGELEPICFWDWSKTEFFLRRYRSILPRLGRQKIRSKFRRIRDLCSEMKMIENEPDVILNDLLGALSITGIERLEVGELLAALEAEKNGDELQFWKIVLSKPSFTGDQELAIFYSGKKIKEHEAKKGILHKKFHDHRYDLSLTMYDVIKDYRIAAKQFKNLRTKNEKAFSILSDYPYAKAMTRDESEKAYLCGMCNLWVLGLPMFGSSNKRKKHFHCIICGMPVNHNDPCWIKC